MPTTVDVATAREWLQQPRHVTVIDVRSPAEFETVHIDGSVNVPLPLVEQQTRALAAALDGPTVLVCQSGVRAAQAGQRLAGVGADDAQVLDGGIAAYIAAGGDVVRGRARWSLERQVRLIAGTLVSAGLLVNLRVPKARLLAAGIGAGLTISALTDTCTMGRILAALPYNRGAADPNPADVLAKLASKPR